MSFSHDNELELKSFRRLKSYIATFSRPHLCAIPPTLVGRLFKGSVSRTCCTYWREWLRKIDPYQDPFR